VENDFAAHSGHTEFAQANPDLDNLGRAIATNPAIASEVARSLAAIMVGPWSREASRASGFLYENWQLPPGPALWVATQRRFSIYARAQALRGLPVDSWAPWVEPLLLSLACDLSERLTGRLRGDYRSGPVVELFRQSLDTDELEFARELGIKYAAATPGDGANQVVAGLGDDNLVIRYLQSFRR
jgi:hypothetical protein